jgi:hypothetical protein
VYWTSERVVGPDIDISNLVIPNPDSSDFWNQWNLRDFLSADLLSCVALPQLLHRELIANDDFSSLLAAGFDRPPLSSGAYESDDYTRKQQEIAEMAFHAMYCSFAEMPGSRCDGDTSWDSECP